MILDPDLAGDRYVADLVSATCTEENGGVGTAQNDGATCAVTGDKRDLPSTRPRVASS